MKCIVIGLGHFGVALSQRLTALGHEVIGVDNDLNKVNQYKDTITTTIALDVRSEQALGSLPLKDVDIVFVVIGKDFGTSLYVLALLKQFSVKRIIARAISEVHKTILETMGISEIISPEWEYADFFALKVELATTIDSYVVDANHVIIEWEVPVGFVGRKLIDVDFEREFGLKLVTLKRLQDKEDKPTVLANIPDDLILQKRDVLVLFGLHKNFRKLGIQLKG